MKDDDFETPKKTTKRLLSSVKSDDQETNKKKHMFITANRFALFITRDQTKSTTRLPLTPFSSLNSEEAPTKINLPPPIFFRGILDFIGFRDDLVRLVGQKIVFYKSSINGLKIQTTKPDHYRIVIHFLKEKKAQYHTYQLREENHSV